MTDLRRRHLGMGEWYVAGVLLIAVGFVVVLTGAVRDSRMVRADLDNELTTLRSTLQRTIRLSALEGFPLPSSVKTHIGVPRIDGEPPFTPIVVVVYTPNVCGACLRAGLHSLRDRWPPHGSRVAVVGERTLRDREYVVQLREQGLLDFEVRFTAYRQLREQLFQHMGTDLVEEPLYLLVGPDSRILSAFQADQRRPELLDLWIDTVRP